jgi:hypothetical protein
MKRFPVTVQNSMATTSAAERMRLTRDRQRRGVVLVSVEIERTQIDAFIAAGRLASERRTDSASLAGAIRDCVEDAIADAHGSAAQAVRVVTPRKMPTTLQAATESPAKAAIAGVGNLLAAAIEKRRQQQAVDGLMAAVISAAAAASPVTLEQV